MEITTTRVSLYGGDTSNSSNGSTTFDNAARALSRATTNATEAMTKMVEISRGFDDVYISPDPIEIKLVLPHKRHLVPRHQEAKRREQLKVWGLRK